MAMHTYKHPIAARLPKDPLTRQIAQAQASRLLSLRLQHRLSRVVAVESTGINWKRIRSIEESSQIASLDAIAKLAALFEVDPPRLIHDIMSIPHICHNIQRNAP